MKSIIPGNPGADNSHTDHVKRLSEHVIYIMSSFSPLLLCRDDLSLAGKDNRFILKGTLEACDFHNAQFR